VHQVPANARLARARCRRNPCSLSPAAVDYGNSRPSILWRYRSHDHVVTIIGTRTAKVVGHAACSLGFRLLRSSVVQRHIHGLMNAVDC
jgi:hypothetical protein